MNERNQFPRLGLLLAAAPLMLSNIASPTFFDVERADRPPAPGAADPACSITTILSATRKPVRRTRTALFTR